MISSSFIFHPLNKGLSIPLKWSPQLTMFLRGRPIGVMLDYDSEADTATMAVADEDGEE